jgi:hypothetical protein
MAKEKTHHAGDDRITSRGTVKGQHEDPDASVPEGGKAPAPTRGPGQPLGSESRAVAEGNDIGDGTSSATAGKREKEGAEKAGSMKPQSAKAQSER